MDDLQIVFRSLPEYKTKHDLEKHRRISYNRTETLLFFIKLNVAYRSLEIYWLLRMTFDRQATESNKAIRSYIILKKIIYLVKNTIHQIVISPLDTCFTKFGSEQFYHPSKRITPQWLQWRLQAEN